MVDPTAVFARAVGVLKLPAVEASGVDSLVIALSGLVAGAPASVFCGAADLKELHIFSAAIKSCERICGICS